MASITIRRLDENTKQRLRVRAAEHGRSMEEEAREILKVGVAQEGPTGKQLWDAIRARFEPLGGVDLSEYPRGPMREPPSFD